MLVGDFNVGEIDCETYAVNPNVNNWAAHEKLLEIIEQNSLTQYQMEPTRLGKILNLFMTNRPKIVQIYTLCQKPQSMAYPLLTVI